MLFIATVIAECMRNAEILHETDSYRHCLRSKHPCKILCAPWFGYQSKQLSMQLFLQGMVS